MFLFLSQTHAFLSPPLSMAFLSACLSRCLCPSVFLPHMSVRACLSPASLFLNFFILYFVSTCFVCLLVFVMSVYVILEFVFLGVCLLWVVLFSCLCISVLLFCCCYMKLSSSLLVLPQKVNVSSFISRNHPGCLYISVFSFFCHMKHSSSVLIVPIREKKKYFVTYITKYRLSLMS